MQSPYSRYPRPEFTLREAVAALWNRAGPVRAERVERPRGRVWRVDGDEDQPASQHGTQARGAVQQSPAAPVDSLRAAAMATYTRSLLEPLVARLVEQEQVSAAQPRSSAASASAWRR